MAVTVSKQHERRLGGKAGRLTYLIKGTDDEETALTNLQSTAPTTLGSLSRDTVEVEAIEDLDMFVGLVGYKRVSEEPLEAGESSYTFDTGGGTQHITQSISTVGSYGDDKVDLGGAIGYNGEDVEGVDIVIPVFNFTETHCLAAATVNAAYKATLTSLTGKVNSDVFKGYAIGEVLFLGASGSQRGSGSGDDWEITYKFAVQKNATGLTVGDITAISKKGWEYMWVQYKESVDETAGVVLKEPAAVYIEQVYETAAFAGLGI